MKSKRCCLLQINFHEVKIHKISHTLLQPHRVSVDFRVPQQLLRNRRLTKVPFARHNKSESAIYAPTLSKHEVHHCVCMELELYLNLTQ